MENTAFSNIKEKYKENKAHYSNLVKSYNNKLLLNSLSRLIVFLGIITLIVLYIKHHYAFYIFAGLPLFFLFAFFLKRHQSIKFKISIHEELYKLNLLELSALEFNFSGFKDTGSDFNEYDHDYTNDLDIFGEGSLYQMLNRTSTHEGRESLASRLKNNQPENDPILNNQKAILELEPELNWRQSFYAHGKLISIDNNERNDFFSWLKESPAFTDRFFYSLIRYLVPILIFGSLILLIVNTISFTVFILVFLVPFIILGFDLKKINRIHSVVSKRSEFLRTYSNLFEMVENQNPGSVVLTELKNKLFINNSSASKTICSLAKIINAFDSRLNIIAGMLLNGFLMWDYHCLIRLEKWKICNQDYIPEWFRVIGEMDALISLANFNYNNPDYCLPLINSNSRFYLECTTMGHPLIHYSERICNDFKCKDIKCFVIITGANMSGKSTFLRTLGINMILASMGTKVCSGQFTYTPITLYTSMRTTDSLVKHESYFYAELQRLQHVLKKLNNGIQVFILLDEILKGTNSFDKLQGSIIFLKQLLGMNCSGIIATHDLSLAEIEQEYPQQIQNMCFEIEIQDSEIVFDYKLLPGITKKMNAILLMKQMGLIPS